MILTSSRICDIRVFIRCIVDDALPTSDHLHSHIPRGKWDPELGNARSDRECVGRTTALQDYRGRCSGKCNCPHCILLLVQCPYQKQQVQGHSRTSSPNLWASAGCLPKQSHLRDEDAPRNRWRPPVTELESEGGTRDMMKEVTNSNSWVLSCLERGDIICRQIKPRGVGKVGSPCGSFGLDTFDRSKANTQD